MKLILERQIQLAFIFALILLLTLGFFGNRSANSLNDAVKLEKHTQEVLMRLNETLDLGVAVETGARGFALTGNESFLETSVNAEREFNEKLAVLHRLIADNPKQVAELEKLQSIVTEKINFNKNMVELRRAKGLSAASEKVGTGEGSRIMEQARLSVGRMIEEENRLLKEREDALTKNISNTLFILFMGTFGGVLCLGLANFAIFRETRKRRLAESDLRDSNKNLEERVEERTRELSASNEKLKEQVKQREQAETRRQMALEAGSLGTWTLDPKTHRVEIDERSLSLFGLSGTDFDGSGEKAFSRIHEEDFPEVEKLFQASVAERRKLSTEFRVKMPDGSLRWNQCTGQPQFDEDGEIIHIVGNCRDVTDGKEFENTLRRNENFTRSILDSLSAHIAVLDKDGVIVAVNKAWENFAQANCLVERLDATGIGQNYLKVCENSAAFEADTKKVLDNLRAILRGERTSFSFEYPCHSPSEESWFLLQVSAMQGAAGGAVISHIDISGRKKAESELKNSEQFNRSIFENSPDCVKVLELDGTLHAMNTNGLCLMEIDDLSLFAGKKWVDFWEGDENELAYQAVQRALRGESAHFEGFCKTAKGKMKYWDVSVSPVFDAQGKLSRLISTSRDVTERREAEEERERLLENEKAARKDAEIANRMRDEFLATVSHELRAPLNSILGWGRLMEKGKLDEVMTAKAVGTIVRNAESQNRLIEDLLDVSRIISGKLRLEVMTINPINVVESALETVRPAAEAKGIKLEIKEDDEVSHISGDPNRLQQVIWNLLSNAIKFTPSDGVVRLEIERTDDFVELRVKDTGVGIKEEFLPHVFDRFRQADASSIRKFGGLGLGLAIVRHITEMHGGTVHVFSEGENRGSTFVVRLPLIASPKETGEIKTEDKRRSLKTESSLSLAGLLILVVDDEEDTRQLLTQSLTFYGATVINAASAAAGFTELTDKTPDVLVSDIGMPDEDGYSFIRKVRMLSDDKLKDIPAVALTGFARAQDRMRALASGFQNHVAKPVEPDELVTVIASLTGRLQINEQGAQPQTETDGIR
jgi:PAS domain S-box-containing protein